MKIINTVLFSLCIYASCIASLSANPAENRLDNLLGPSIKSNQTAESKELKEQRKNLYYANAELMKEVDNCITQLGPDTVINWARKKLYSSESNEYDRKVMLIIIDRAMQYKNSHDTGSSSAGGAAGQQSSSAQAQIEWDTQQRIEAFCKEGGDAQGLINAAAAERDSSSSPQIKKYWNTVIKEAKLYLKNPADE